MNRPESPTVTARQTYSRLLAYLRPHIGLFCIGVVGAALFALTSASIGLIAKAYLDGTFLERDQRMLLLVPFGLIALFAVRGLGDFTQTYFMGQVGRRVVKQLRSEVFERLLHLPLNYYDRAASGTLLSRLTYNTEQVAQATTDSVVTAVREALTIIGSLSVLFYLNARLAAMAILIAPVIAWLISTINRHFRRYSQRIQNSMGEVTRVAKEAIEAPRVIKVFNAEAYEAAQFEIVNEQNRRSNMKLVFTRGISNPIVQLIASIALAAVMYIATKDAVQGRLTVGEFTGFITTLLTVAQPLRSLVNVAGPLQQGIAAGQSLFELLDEPSEPQFGDLRVERAKGEVVFDQVSFAYQEGRARALDNVTLKIAPGETVAIVGRSGSGKTTLVGLLPRFYQPTSGGVKVDGRDVREYDLKNLRAQVALVSQEVVLFNDTIRNNIAFGLKVTPEALEKAAKAAHVLEFVEQLPDGLNSVVGDRGVLLSGGQRQRIAIARALLKDAPILILDEATSALDTESERTIQAALEELMQNRTTLVIAHRLSTVENADRIVVLANGSIVESGTHAQLLALDGHYAALHRMQFNA